MSIPNPKSVILIVDDNPETIQLLSAQLKHKGDILFATNGRDAIALAEREVPHLILLDMDMPDMSGEETCRQLKSNPLTRACTVIFITAHTSTEMELAAFEAGAVDFICKPFNPTVVNARVRTHLTLKHQSDSLQSLANRDGLTGVYNRRFFDRKLDEEFKRHTRHGSPLAVALLDIDFFKAFNDGYGHPEGDSCLIRVAEALSSGFRRPGEVFARFGGEEFAVILPHADPESLYAVGDWICKLVRELDIPHAYSSVAPHVSVSVGISALPSGQDQTVKDLIASADAALYRAKAHGRNRSEIASVVSDL
ncbi:diguanylate cyclase domain-containing protein [Marinobacter caseinilyticus]|uniref:diguanylate cyclase domain-containing protein n=1 Tax=Marinobacter caseinilyticus TaxID=2692195 RepID=UPI00140CE1DC|nr:diguanylate cyclase [Marinobacter caseinilyticus]